MIGNDISVQRKAYLSSSTFPFFSFVINVQERGTDERRLGEVSSRAEDERDGHQSTDQSSMNHESTKRNYKAR